MRPLNQLITEILVNSKAFQIPLSALSRYFVYVTWLSVSYLNDRRFFLAALINSISSTKFRITQLKLMDIPHGHLVCNIYTRPRSTESFTTEYRLGDNSQRPMEVVTNSFCAVWSFVPRSCTPMTSFIKGGNVLGNGTWLSVGGNQAITTGGKPATSQDGSSGPYYDADGRHSYVSVPCRSLLFLTHLQNPVGPSNPERNSLTILKVCWPHVLATIANGLFPHPRLLNVGIPPCQSNILFQYLI